MSAHSQTEEVLLGAKRLEVSYTTRSVSDTGRCDGCSATVQTTRTEFDVLEIRELPDRVPYTGRQRNEIERLLRANVMIRGGALAPVAFLCDACSGI